MVLLSMQCSVEDNGGCGSELMAVGLSEFSFWLTGPSGYLYLFMALRLMYWLVERLGSV